MHYPIQFLKPFRLLLLLLLPSLLFAQQQPDRVTEPEKQQLIDSIGKYLNRWYIYPEVAKQMSDFIASNAKKGVYKQINAPLAFASKLTTDLIQVSKDKHLNITFDPDWVAFSKKVKNKKDSIELDNRDFPNARAENFGFKDVKILDGNVGYLNLTKFYNPLFAGETAEAAMNLLANTDALIIDLRQNGGGYGEMVQLLASYFFDPEPVLLVEFYSREDGKTKQDWTLPYLPGKRMPDKDLYLLTSAQTFSAAESFSYFLKNRKRATLVGEITGGGAHPVEHKALTDRFSIYVPYGKPVDPVTKTNWEHIGISPDIAVPPNDALPTAQIAALEKITATHPENRYADWALTALKASQHPVRIPLSTLQTYAGSYSSGTRKLILEKDTLSYQKTGMPKLALIPLSPDLFAVRDLSYLRIKITVEHQKVTGFTRLYDDGTAYSELRD